MEMGGNTLSLDLFVCVRSVICVVCFSQDQDGGNGKRGPIL